MYVIFILFNLLGCWAIEGQDVHKMEVVEMRMLDVQKGRNEDVHK